VLSDQDIARNRTGVLDEMSIILRHLFIGCVEIL
jgi:hypothetical protein